MRQPESLESLLEILKSVMAGVSDPAEPLRLILDRAVQETGADRGVFVEVRREGELAYRVLHRMKADALSGPAGDYSNSIFRDAIDHRRTVRLDNAAATDRYATAESVREMRLVSILCVPILTDGEVTALIHLENRAPGHFTADHERLVSSLLQVVGPAYHVLRAGEDVLEERNAAREARSRAEERLREERSVADWSFARFVGRSDRVKQLEQRIRKASGRDFPVLLLGETGTGKGVLARILHHASTRREGPFVTVFCPSLERGLVESELFGHLRGAFTGADQDREGKVEVAAGGTLFLDEIGELPLEIQPKILRLLQEKTFERRGEARERKADVRIVAATNLDLDEEVRAGRFRRDLFERLNFLPVRVPPLRERLEDLPALLRHALDHVEGGRWIELAPDVFEKLAALDHLWPGNVREVEQLAARLSIEEPVGPLTWDEVREAMDDAGDAPQSDEGSADLEGGLPALMRRSEKSWLVKLIARYPDLSRRELAERLQISETTLYAKLKAHGLKVQ